MKRKHIWISTLLIDPIQKKIEVIVVPKKKRKEKKLVSGFLFKRTKHFDVLFILVPFEWRTEFYLHRCDSVYHNIWVTNVQFCITNDPSIRKIVVVVAVIFSFVFYKKEKTVKWLWWTKENVWYLTIFIIVLTKSSKEHSHRVCVCVCISK